MTESPVVAFLILLAALLLWMALPLIPALMELIRPRDAAPLSAVGSDSGELTFFAESFARRASHEGLLGTMVPSRLADGSAVRTHSATRPLPVQSRPFSELTVLMDSTPLPDGAELASECLARLTVHGGSGTTFRALLGQRDIFLGPGSSVLRWVHARGRLEAADGTRLLGRATAERQIVLGRNVVFDRLQSEVIRVTDVETFEAPMLPTAAYERFIPAKAREFAASYWRVDDGVTIPAGRSMSGALIATGSVVVSDGARVSGPIKAHEEVVVRNGAVVIGSISARGRITLEKGSRVSGPVISETAVVIEAAVVGSAGSLTTVTAPVIRLLPGATIYGAVMAGDDGLTIE